MTVMSVHALPTELLLDIFNLVAKDPPDKGDMVTVCTGLSHVCQRWRQIAVSCEAFWTVLPRRSTQWTNLCLSRCPSALLQLDFRASMAQDTDYQHAARLVFPRFMRAKHLRLALDHNSATLLEEISAALPAWPLAIIEDVDVAFRRRAYPHVEQLPLLPAALFPSALQSVHIDSCTLLNAPTIFPPGIRRIELIDVRPWSTVHLVIQFFRAIPQLEYFLYRTTRHGLEVPIDWQAPLPETRCVSLKHLRGLHLEGSLVDNYIIFSILVLQPSVSLTIKELLRNPSSRYLFLVLRGPSVEQYRNLTVRSGSALRSHFSEAIDRGAHYDVVRLDERSINTVCDDKAKPAHNWKHAAILPNSSELSLEALS
ncbi:hypothetical protein PENSPDRAFT_493498 [Peniophora sp. CONT]|nr:hypothetical protein PENSPDRAFT_493498 [Peniophora sp. CONT]